MKTTLSLVLFAAAAGAALAKLANASFLAALPAEIIFAGAVSVALVALTIADYARNVRPLVIKSPLVRVALPNSVAPRSSAYGIRRRTPALVERSAA